MIKLLERDSFLQKLDAALQEAMINQGHVVLVSGEAGIGKTSLVDHFTQAYQDAVRILWGACDSLFTPRPLGPLYDIAMQVDGELSALLRSDVNRQTIFSACLAEMQRRPTIAVFEDVHWADEATLDLIKFLGRRIQRTAALLILTYREDDLGAGHPLHLVFGDLPRSVTLRLPLLPLSQASVMELAHDAKQDERVNDLYTKTGGNPFFVTEVLANGDGGVPPTVRDAVLARAARLSTAAREVLNVASVVPGSIEAWLLNIILEPAPVAVEECVERGMLRLDGDIYAFRHELARRALEDVLPASQRRSLNQQILKALIERGNEQVQLSRLVHHAAFAGDGNAVLYFAPQAARQAAMVGSHLEAAAHYQTALHYADRLDLTEHAQLLENRAYECYLTSQMSDAIRARMLALEIWRRSQNPMQEGNNLRWLSRLHWFSGNQAQAERYAVEAIHILETLPPGRELAMAYSNRAQLHMLANETADAIRLGNQAIALAEEFGDLETLSHALNNVGTSEMFSHYSASGHTKLERSLQFALAHGFHEHAARAYTNLASQSVDHRRYDQAMQYLNDGIVYSTERDLDAWKLYMLAWRARAYFEQGHWTEANEDALAVLDNPRASAVARIPAMAVFGHLRLRRGELDALQVLDDARNLAIPTGELQRIGPIACARAESNWLQGDLEQCVTEARVGYELALKNENSRLLEELSFWIWRAGGPLSGDEQLLSPFALQIAGDWRAAADAWEQLGCPYERAMALMDGDNAAQLLALEIFERLGAQPTADIMRNKLHATSQQKLDKDKFGGLTAREREVATLIAQGKSNREIAESMTVGVKTVETYVTRVLNKLGFDSRVQIATWAMEKGLR
ncbi:MAG: AAA family ATPase [Chloroflexi bacterium]|nr:AAA family ATPase [Chloroflexota bacterium]